MKKFFYISLAVLSFIFYRREIKKYELKEIKVYLDEEIVYRGIKDLLNETFEGKGDVIWGFTASTGRKHNLQYFCFLRLAVIN